ncbi:MULTISPECIES: trypsin-like peptidase domain-containing protein [unclassified Stenotrophomonas maltophilia group]|uniref:trypsin-like peptidase domain-containing protein n=1 Tax=unclassified Stenotrophomonas maltophilia group TaxID=2961925 RepID=UPI003BF8C0A5
MRTLAVLLLASLAGCADARPSVERYTYRIGTQDRGLCSATAVGREVLLTAKHCIAENDSVVYLGDKRVTIRHIEVDGRDHALLWVDERFPVWAQFGPPPKVGDEIEFYGNSEGLNQVYRRGYVAAYLGAYMYSDAMVGRGDSGAGIFNSSGQLVGVVSAVHIGEIVRYAVSFPLTAEIKRVRHE